MIDTEKLHQITTLAHGSHEPTDGAMCAMEAAAYIANEPWSDHPQCVSPVIAAFMRSWNDALPDAERTRLLLPLIPDTIGTRTTDADEETRAWMATDWLVRVQAPAWLRLAGLTDHAQTLESCARIVDEVTAGAEQPKINAARSVARLAAESVAESAARLAAESVAESAVRSAVRSAAWSVAWSAAWSAARLAAESVAESAAWLVAESAARSVARLAAESAVRSAAWSAAESAAWSAVRSAAWSVARSAAEDALAPTVTTLQASACDLVRAMCAVGREAA